MFCTMCNSVDATRVRRCPICCEAYCPHIWECGKHSPGVRVRTQQVKSKPMITRYYRESNGDYIAVDLSTANYYKQLGKSQLEGRASAIAGRPSSVCTVALSLEFLKTCTPVEASDVPAEWRQMF